MIESTSLLEYPCDFPIKILGHTQAGFAQAILDVVTGTDRAEGAGRDLPGWRLIERPAARDGADDMPRRLIVTRDDVVEP